MKLLQSEGALAVSSTGKDPSTGELVTHQYRVEGPVMIFFTTTAIRLDEELLNRWVVLTVNEGRSQTKTVDTHYFVVLYDRCLDHLRKIRPDHGFLRQRFR